MGSNKTALRWLISCLAICSGSSLGSNGVLQHTILASVNTSNMLRTDILVSLHSVSKA